MEKKAYITPAIEVVSPNLTMEVLTTIISGSNAKISSSNSDSESYEQRSRGNFWDDEEE